MSRRSPMKYLIAFVLVWAAASQAVAQGYPNRPVRIVVPYGTGGGSDILARQLAQKLGELWGQGVAVENRPGASGNLGTELVVKAPADGYTLVMQNTTITVNPALMSKMPFDVVKDLTPIVLVGFTPITIVAHPSAKLSSLRELTEAAKGSPGKFAYGSCGNGTPQNFAVEFYQVVAGVNLIHAPYKGCAPGLVDVLGGQVPLAVLSSNMVAPYIKNGRLKGLAVTSRAAYAPTAEVPTMEALGYKDFDFGNWYGLMGPAGMPQAIVDKIQADVLKVMAMPDVVANLSSAGVEKMPGTATQMAEQIRMDLARYARLAKQANIKVE